jgi:hypothetical protein
MKIHNHIFIIGLVLIFFIGTVSASDTHWNPDEIKSTTLHLGEHVDIDNGNYTIEFTDTNEVNSDDDDFQALMLFKDNKKSISEPFLLTEQFNSHSYIYKNQETNTEMYKIETIETDPDILTYETNDGENFSTGKMVDPTVEFAVFEPANYVPEFEIEFDTNKDAYEPSNLFNNYINLKLNITNNPNDENAIDDECDAKNVLIKVDTGELEIKSGDEQEIYHSIVKNDEDIELNYKLGIPYVYNERDYPINVQITGQSIDGESFTSEANTSITVNPCWGIVVSKTIHPYPAILHEDDISVKVSVSNNGSVNLDGVNVIDTYDIMDGIGVNKIESYNKINNSELSANMSLVPGETKTVFEYELIPTASVGSYSEGIDMNKSHAIVTLPSGEKHKIESNDVKIHVLGPNINLNKKLIKSDPKNNSYSIGLVVNNTGNMKSRVKIIDHIPEDIEILNTSDGFEDFESSIVLGSGNTFETNYTFSYNGSGIILPSFDAIYHIGVTGDGYNASSNVLEIGDTGIESEIEKSTNLHEVTIDSDITQSSVLDNNSNSSKKKSGIVSNIINWFKNLF